MEYISNLCLCFFFSSSFDGPDDNSLDMSESDGHTRKDSKSFSREIPIFLSCATPDEFLVCLCFSIHGCVIVSSQVSSLIFICFDLNASLGINDKGRCPP